MRLRWDGANATDGTNVTDGANATDGINVTRALVLPFWVLHEGCWALWLWMGFGGATFCYHE